MKVFRVGDRIKLSEGLLQYSANKNWVGKRGTVLKVLDCSHILVKWDHLENPMEQPIDYVEIERV